MRPWSWAWNAALRTVRGVHRSLVAPDDDWASSRLSEGELGLYLAMDPRDRDHAVRVARELLRRHPGAPDVVVRAALLHDVGKSRRRYRVDERILVHLVKASPPPAEPPRNGIAGARQTAAHHAAYGATMIRDAGGSPRLAELVARHDRPPDDDAHARWVHEADRCT